MSKSLSTIVFAALILAAPLSAPAQPMSGSYDIGGGLNHFPDIITAIDTLEARGMGGPLTFNVYSGTYEGQVDILADSIQGIGSALFVLQAAPGESPRIINPNNGGGIHVLSASYITIRGLEIDCIERTGVSFGGYPNEMTNIIVENNYVHNCGTSNGWGSICLSAARNCIISGNEIEGDFCNIDISRCYNCIVVNNIAYNTRDYAFRDSDGGGNKYYYNSIYHNGRHHTFDVSESSGCELMNNIFYSTSSDRSDYIIFAGYHGFQLVSNYNCFYNPNGINIGLLNGNAYADFRSWQTGTGLDQQSVNLDPQYMSIAPPYDLHIRGDALALNGMGFPIPGITIDIDGDLRNPTSPDIGADEYTPALPQYGVTLFPRRQFRSGNTGQPVDHKLRVINSGSNTDIFDLSVAGAAWQTGLFDSAGVIPITATSILAPEEFQWFIARHYIPDSVTAIFEDSGLVIAVSHGNPTVSDTALITTGAALAGSFDIGGGANDFPSITDAVSVMNAHGVGGPLTFNVYPGIYNGMVSVHRDSVSGICAANPLIFNALPAAHNPVIVKNTIGSGFDGDGFRSWGVDYITIKNFEIDSCDRDGISLYPAEGNDSVHHCTIENNYIHNIGFGGDRCGIYLNCNHHILVNGNEIEGDYYGVYTNRGRDQIITNNMVYGQEYCGIYLDDPRSQAYHNSMFIYSHRIDSWALCAYAEFLDVKNNIFYNAGNNQRHRCYSVPADLIAYPVSSDYNDFYAPNGASIGYFNNTYYMTFTEWQNATGLDSNSLNVDPAYLDTTDLHITGQPPSPVDGMGIPVPGVYTDFDGEVRNLTTPDIGCDEINTVMHPHSVYVNPENQTRRGNAGAILDFYFNIVNTGGVIDRFTLSAAAAAWQTRIYDSTGTTPISQTRFLPHLENQWVSVRVNIPAGTFAATTDSGFIVARSRFNPAVADTGFFTAITMMNGGYDIGGGNRDFTAPVNAVDTLRLAGLGGPVTLNLFTGVYDGQVEIANDIYDLGEYPIIIQAAPNQNPVISNTTGGLSSLTGNGIRLTNAKNITIRGLEIAYCDYYGVLIDYSNYARSNNCIVENNYIHNVGLLAQYAAPILVSHCHDCKVVGNEISGGYRGIYVAGDNNNLIANNMIYNQWSCGLSVDSYTSMVCYNSVYMNSSESYSRAFGFDDSHHTYVLNNIFCNMGHGDSHRAYELGTGFSDYVSDYNNLYAPNGAVGYYREPYITLSDFQAATGIDSHSISADPFFVSVSNPDLHISNYLLSPVDSAGVPITDITTDFDGDIRHPRTPDIGADEFTYRLLANSVYIEPRSQRSVSPPGGTANYYFNILNTGSSSDVFNLSVSGADWLTAIYDSSGTNVIASTGNLAFLENQWVMVEHSVPAVIPGGTLDTGFLVARANSAPATADSVTFATGSTSMTGSFDVGGGANDFSTIIEAVDSLYTLGMAGPVTINVYTGAYYGGVSIDWRLPGLEADNPLTFKAAEGQSPRIVNFTGVSGMGYGFSVIGASNITIRGFEIDSTDRYGIRIAPYETHLPTNCLIRNNYIHDYGLYNYSYNCRGIYVTGSRNCRIIANEINSPYIGISVYEDENCLIANNMVYGSGPNTYGCIVVNYGTYEIYYNSFYLNTGSSYSYLFSLYGTTGIIRNNIIFGLNSGSRHIAFYCSGEPNFDSDYNCIYAPNCAFGCCSSDTVYSLTEWQTVTGQDLHSISVNPVFLSPTDLHIAPTSPCARAGIPIDSIVMDIDGELRHPGNPSIGCDEITTGFTVTLRPQNPPVIIPSGGGSFRFDAILQNTYDSTITFDAWTEVILPNGSAIAPLVLRRDLVIQPGQTIQRTGITQTVPGRAPLGEYTYFGNIGVFPGMVASTDSFTFVKLAGDDAANHIEGWACYGFFGAEGEYPAVPSQYSLTKASPNPFNQNTHIAFTLPEKVKVKLVVYDITGRRTAVLIEEVIPAGYHQAVFDASRLASGIYFVRMKAGDFSKTKKVVLIK